jgi:hypothetical protein
MEPNDHAGVDGKDESLGKCYDAFYAMNLLYMIIPEFGKENLSQWQYPKRKNRGKGTLR